MTIKRTSSVPKKRRTQQVPLSNLASTQGLEPARASPMYGFRSHDISQYPVTDTWYNICDLQFGVVLCDQFVLFLFFARFPVSALFVLGPPAGRRPALLQ